MEHFSTLDRENSVQMLTGTVLDAEVRCHAPLPICEGRVAQGAQAVVGGGDDDAVPRREGAAVVDRHAAPPDLEAPAVEPDHDREPVPRLFWGQEQRSSTRVRCQTYASTY